MTCDYMQVYFSDKNFNLNIKEIYYNLFMNCKFYTKCAIN